MRAVPGKVVSDRYHARSFGHACLPMRIVKGREVICSLAGKFCSFAEDGTKVQRSR